MSESTTNEEWQWVPKDPTQEMLDAGETCEEGTVTDPWSWMRNQYQAMLAVAPSRPSGEVVTNIGPRKQNADMVICPNCTCQFHAIPENAQALIRALHATEPHGWLIERFDRFEGRNISSWLLWSGPNNPGEKTARPVWFAPPAAPINERLLRALKRADEHLTVLYPHGYGDGDFICCTVRNAIAEAEGTKKGGGA